MEANESKLIRPHFKVVQIVDGDGLIVENIFTKEQEEVRIYGIDAPELKPSNKLLRDEKELNLPAEFLIELGNKSLNFMLQVVRPGDRVTLVQEKRNMVDGYGRTLAYVILENSQSVGEILIENGFAKPYSKVYCDDLPKYQMLSLKAKSEKKGLFLFSDTF